MQDTIALAHLGLLLCLSVAAEMIVSHSTAIDTAVKVGLPGLGGGEDRGEGTRPFATAAAAAWCGVLNSGMQQLEVFD
jgi:hypothetical protein